MASEAPLDLTQVLAPVAAEREAIKARIAEKSAELAAEREELRKVENVLKAAGLMERPNTNGTADRRRPPSKPPPDTEKIEMVVHHLLDNYDPDDADDVFTANSIERGVEGVSNEMAQRVIEELRRGGFVRLHGAVRGGGRGFRVTPAINQFPFDESSE
jgi:hypothetical protein